MGSKGLVGNVMAIILVVVIFVVLLAATVMFSGLFGKKGKEDICRNSLIMMDASKHLGIGAKEMTDPMVSPKCPVENLEIKSASSMASIHRELAEAMRRCWSKTGEASINPFSSKLFDGRIYCILCTKITFDKEIQKNFKEITGLTDYLKGKKMLASSKSYYQYLTPADTELEVVPPDIANKKDSHIDSLDTSKTYYLVWYVRKYGVVGIPLLGGLKTNRDSVQLLFLDAESPKDWQCDFIYQ